MRLDFPGGFLSALRLGWSRGRESSASRQEERQLRADYGYGCSLGGSARHAGARTGSDESSHPLRATPPDAKFPCALPYRGGAL
jgi:hypothetical protein